MGGEKDRFSFLFFPIFPFVEVVPVFRDPAAAYEDTTGDDSVSALVLFSVLFDATFAPRFLDERLEQATISIFLSGKGSSIVSQCIFRIWPLS